MKIIYFIIVLFLSSYSNLLAGQSIIEFRLAFEGNKPNTEIAFDKAMAGNVFVKKNPFLTISDISEATLIIDDTKAPIWLEQAIKSHGAQMNNHRIGISFSLNEPGRKKLVEITSKNIGNRVAVFIDGGFIMAAKILEKLEHGFFISSPYTENKTHEFVNRINNVVLNKKAI